MGVTCPLPKISDLKRIIFYKVCQGCPPTLDLILEIRSCIMQFYHESFKGCPESNEEFLWKATETFWPASKQLGKNKLLSSLKQGGRLHIPCFPFPCSSPPWLPGEQLSITLVFRRSGEGKSNSKREVRFYLRFQQRREEQEMGLPLFSTFFSLGMVWSPKGNTTMCFSFSRSGKASRNTLNCLFHWGPLLHPTPSKQACQWASLWKDTWEMAGNYT